jgi:hypothetical protein
VKSTITFCLFIYLYLKNIFQSDKPQNQIGVSDLVVSIEGTNDGFLADHYYFAFARRNDIGKQWRVRAAGVFNGRAWVDALAANGALIRFPDHCVQTVALEWRELFLVRAAQAGARHYFACLRGAADASAAPPGDLLFAVEKRLDVIAAAAAAMAASVGEEGTTSTNVSSTAAVAHDDGIMASIAVMPRRVLPLVVTLGEGAPADQLRVVVIDSGTGLTTPVREVPNAPRRVERLDDGVSLRITLYVELLAESAHAALYITAQCTDQQSPVCPVVVADLLSPSFRLAAEPDPVAYVPADAATAIPIPAATVDYSQQPAPRAVSPPPRSISPLPRSASPPPSIRPASPRREAASSAVAAAAAAVPVFRVAKYSFAATKPSQMSMEKGDVIEVLEQGGPWWRGRICNSNPERSGKFPETYTEPIAADEVQSRSMRSGSISGAGVASSASSSSSSASTYRALALFDWQSDNAADLQFRKGDELAVTGAVDDNWLLGTVLGGQRVGKFPRNRVERIAEEAPLPLPTSPSPVSRAGAAAAASTALRMLAVDETYLVSVDGDSERYRCTKEPTVPEGVATIMLPDYPRGSIDLTCAMGARVPLAITTDAGRRDCSVKVMCGKTKLERGKQWRIESQAFRQTAAGDVTTLFITFRYSPKLGDSVRIIASLDGQVRTLTVCVVDNMAIIKRGKNPLSSSSSSAAAASVRLSGGDAQQLAAWRAGERLRARRADDRASLSVLNNGELVALIAATHEHSAPSAAELDALADSLVDRLAACQQKGGDEGVRAAAEASLLKMALRAHEDASERRDTSLLPLLDAAVAFGVK